MSDYTGGGFNYDFWSQYLDDEDTTTDTTTTDTTTTGTAADTNAVIQFIDDLFEDPTFIENLNQLTETQNWNPEEQSFEDWANEDWNNYFNQLLSGDEGSGFDYDFWSDWLDLDDDPHDPYHEDDDVGQAPHGTLEDGSPLPDPRDYEEGDRVGSTAVGIYECGLGPNGEKIWTKVEGGTTETEEGETVDINENPLPPTADVKIGERHEVIDENGRTVIYECSLGTDGKTKIWTKVEEEDKDDDLPKGIFGGTLGPKIKEWLKGVFGIPEGFEEDDAWWQKLIKIYLGGKQFKEGLDAVQYEVPTGQGAAVSDYEKANPLDIDMGLESLGPNYLQDQLYGIPIGAENVPAATHTLGFPYAEEIPVETEEEVQGAQRGGIMNARSHGDIVPALLEPGEFVMNLQSVKGAGNGDARQGAKRMYKMMRQLERMG